MNTNVVVLPVVSLQMFQHRGCKWILIPGDSKISYNPLLRKIPGRKFSVTYRSWLLPANRQSYNQLSSALNNIAIIDSSALKAGVQTANAPVTAAPSVHQISTSLALPSLDKTIVNGEVIPNMLQHLQLKAYSASTVRTYINEMNQFLKAIKGHDAGNFDTERLKNYLQYCHNSLKLSENTIYSRMNSLKFYYEQVLKREKLFWEIPRPKKPLILPKLLNETELARLFNALTNKSIRLCFLLHTVPDLG